MDPTPKHQQNAPRQTAQHRVIDIPPEVFQQFVRLSKHYPVQQLLDWFGTFTEAHARLAHSPDAALDDAARPRGQRGAQSSPDPTTSRDDLTCACPSCWRQFNRASDMTRHFMSTCKKDKLTGTRMKVWKCPVCLKKLPRKDHFHKHHLMEHGFRYEGDEPIQWDSDYVALACGFCPEGRLHPITQVKDLDDYLDHIVNHFRRNATRADWSTTRQIWSLLSQSHVFQTVVCLGQARFGPSWCYMTWTMDSRGIGDAINALERQISVHELERCLSVLLESGTLHQQPAPVSSQSSNAPWLPFEIIDGAIGGSFGTPMCTGFGTAAASGTEKQGEVIEPRGPDYRWDTDGTTLASSAGTVEHYDGALGFPGMLGRPQSSHEQPLGAFPISATSAIDNGDPCWYSGHTLQGVCSSQQSLDRQTDGLGDAEMSHPDQGLTREDDLPRFFGSSDDSFGFPGLSFSLQSEGMLLDDGAPGSTLGSTFAEGFADVSYPQGNDKQYNTLPRSNYPPNGDWEQSAGPENVMDTGPVNNQGCPASTSGLNPTPPVDWPTGHRRSKSSRYIREALNLFNWGAQR